MNFSKGDLQYLKLFEIKLESHLIKVKVKVKIKVAHRIKVQVKVKVTVKVKAGEEKLLTLQAATNKLTGEKPGDSNTFTITTDLTKEKISDLSVQSVNIQGIDYKNLNLDLE